MNLCLGDKLEKLINKLTFGFGKKFAEWVAYTIFRTDKGCGCSERKEWLNKTFGCKKPIKLIQNGYKFRIKQHSSTLCRYLFRSKSWRQLYIQPYYYKILITDCPQDAVEIIKSHLVLRTGGRSRHHLAFFSFQRLLVLLDIKKLTSLQLTYSFGIITWHIPRQLRNETLVCR